MAKVTNGALTSDISGSLGPVVFARTRFGQVVRSKQRTVVHHSAAALQAKRLMRNGQAGYAKSGGYYAQLLRQLSTQFGTTPAALITGPFLTACYHGECRPKLQWGFNLQMSWGAPYLSGGRWRVPYVAQPACEPFDTALVIPVRDPLTRVFGAIQSPFGIKEFWLPTVASYADAIPPFVILASTTFVQGAIPGDGQVTAFAGFAGLYVAP